MMGIFYECRGLKSLDLSNFDTSKVTDMKWMFLRCEFLKYVNLSSFNTSKVKYIANMFEGCSSLVTLDLSNFDTSEVVDMCFMFASCSSLVSLNLSNFDTAKVTNMAGMFGECSSLEWLDISHFDTFQVKGFDQMFFNCTLLSSLNIFNFDTSNVTNMFAMFYSCKSLTSLDISGFNTSNVDNMEYMFGRCINLEYINFKNANIKESAKLNNIFSETALNLVVCTTDLILISKVNDNECALVDCSDNWKKNRKKIDINTNNCVENCNSNTFEYDSKCYNDCPNGSYRSIYFDSDNNYYNNCINSINGYYLDENDLFYKKCYYTCKTCDKEGDDIYHNCLECKDSYTYHYNYLDHYNCLNICTNYFYWENTTNVLYCTDKLECPINYNKLISNKNECIDDCKNDFNNKYNYLNECYTQCPNGTINNSFICEPILDENKISDTFFPNHITSSIHMKETNDINYRTSINYMNNTNLIIRINNQFDININTENNKNGEIYYEFNIERTLVRFTTINYLKSNKNSSEIIIDLGICEHILKDAYNITYNDSLYILILEIKEEGMKIPKVEYEVFNIVNKTNIIKLNLSFCEESKIKVSIPVNITDFIDKYDSNSGYYNDFCYIFTSEYGTDICLKDRRREFIEKNLTLCEENCKLIDYDYIYKKVKCSCEIKIHLPLLEEIKFDKEKLKNNFKDINNISNIQFMKCYKIVFKK